MGCGKLRNTAGRSFVFLFPICVNLRSSAFICGYVSFLSFSFLCVLRALCGECFFFARVTTARVASRPGQGSRGQRERYLREVEEIPHALRRGLTVRGVTRIEEILPRGLVGAVERAIASYLPLAIERLSIALQQARVQCEQGVGHAVARMELCQAQARAKHLQALVGGRAGDVIPIR